MSSSFESHTSRGRTATPRDVRLPAGGAALDIRERLSMLAMAWTCCQIEPILADSDRPRPPSRPGEPFAPTAFLYYDHRQGNRGVR